MLVPIVAHPFFPRPSVVSPCGAVQRVLSFLTTQFQRTAPAKVFSLDPPRRIAVGQISTEASATLDAMKKQLRAPPKQARWDTEHQTPTKAPERQLRPTSDAKTASTEASRQQRRRQQRKTARSLVEIMEEEAAVRSESHLSTGTEKCAARIGSAQAAQSPKTNTTTTHHPLDD